jgi:Glutaredoxin-like domain (DUF836)
MPGPESEAVPRPTVLLYTRDGCHLCEAVREELLALRGDLPRFELREVDIEGDESLHAAYLERIPVVEVDGELVSELWLDAEALKRTLLARGGYPDGDDSRADLSGDRPAGQRP